MRRSSLFLAIAAVSSAIATCALADTLWQPSKLENVKIKNFRNGQVEYSLDGRPLEKPADKIAQMAIDDEAAFTKAEQAYADGKFAAAADGYQSAMKSTTKAWLKEWMLPRLLISAERGDKFDVAVSSFVQLLKKDPTAATQLRPVAPEDAQAPGLASAAAELAKEASNASLQPAQKQAILSLQMDVLRAQGDLAGAGRVAEQLLKVVKTDSNDPAANRTLAEIHIGVAQLALAQKDYAKAAAQITANKAVFVDPLQQVEALYCLALAKDAQTDPQASPEAIKDLAIEYMRVAAASRATAQKRHLPESLVRVAQIQEKLGDEKAAIALYGEVVSEYKDGPVAAKALKEQQRLKQKAGM